jgi:hypothetical protein
MIRVITKAASRSSSWSLTKTGRFPELPCRERSIHDEQFPQFPSSWIGFQRQGSHEGMPRTLVGKPVAYRHLMHVHICPSLHDGVEKTSPADTET